MPFSVRLQSNVTVFHYVLTLLGDTVFHSRLTLLQLSDTMFHRMLTLCQLSDTIFHRVLTLLHILVYYDVIVTLLYTSVSPSDSRVDDAIAHNRSVNRSRFPSVHLHAPATLRLYSQMRFGQRSLSISFIRTFQEDERRNCNVSPKH